MKKGQPLTHIYAEHEQELPVCLRSLYNYIDAGEMTIKNIDLRRKTGYRRRNGKKEKRHLTKNTAKVEHILILKMDTKWDSFVMKKWLKWIQ